MISPVHASAGATLAASSLLGIAVRSGRIDLAGRRWPHHALYAASLATATGATLVEAAAGRRTWRVAAGTLGVLAVLPATRGGSTAHIAVALAASAFYAVGTMSATKVNAARSPDFRERTSPSGT